MPGRGEIAAPIGGRELPLKGGGEVPAAGNEVENAVMGAGSPVAGGRGPAGPGAGEGGEEEDLGKGGCEGAEVDTGRF